MKMRGDDWQWVTKDGKQLHIQDMETSHIENCLKLIERNGYSSTSLYMGGNTQDGDSWCESEEEDFVELYNNMVLELRLRKLERR